MSRRLDILLERARRVLDETVNDYGSEELFVFDFDKTLQHKYKPLQCAEIMKQHQEAGFPCYIVTARDPIADKKNTSKMCARDGVLRSIKKIYSVLVLTGRKGLLFVN